MTRLRIGVLGLLGLGVMGGLLLLHPASGFACRRCCSQAPPCVIYVERDSGGRREIDPNRNQVHSLLILDSEDSNIGNDAKRETGQMVRLLLDMPVQNLGETRWIGGEDLVREKILNAVKDMDVGKNETLFVYCNMHGALDQKQGTPEHKLITRDADGMLRKDLIAEIEKKDCRLKVLITDSCFQSADTQDDDAAFTKEDIQAIPKFGPAAPKTLSTILRVLLLEHEGFADINSCEEGEVAWPDTFTPSFVQVCQTWEGYDQSWDGFFEKLRADTANRFDKTTTQRLSQSQKDQYKSQKPRQFRLPRRIGTTAGPSPMPAPPGEAGITGPRAKKGYSPGNNAPATFNVSLPEDALLWVDDAATTSRSGKRSFQTPSLPPSREFEYTLTARIKRDGVTAEVKKVIPIRAGHQTDVDFGDMAEALATAANRDSGVDKDARAVADRK